MADFYYKSNISDISVIKFDKLYSNKCYITNDLCVFYNDHTIIQVKQGNDSVTLLGYAYASGQTTEQYLSDLLLNFTEKQIAEIKKQLLGQYTIIIQKGKILYFFSDFLQTRNIYYSENEISVCSSFGVLHAHQKTEINMYKAFEFLAMRHCLYPVCLGNTTLNNQIKRLRAYEYLKIHTDSNTLQVAELLFFIDNSKIESKHEISELTLITLQHAIYHPDLKNKTVSTTITGGFDSRLVTTLTLKYYQDTNLRISTQKDIYSLDRAIAQKVATVLSLPLKIYETDPQKQAKDFYSLTDGLAPRENLTMIQLFQSRDRGTLEFGGAFGTELYTSPAGNDQEEIINNYLNNIKTHLKADESYYNLFRQALQDEFNNLRTHYKLKQQDTRDIIRMFNLLITGFFSSSFISAYNIHGQSFEVFGTFPVIEAGLKIPYAYLGSKWTLGRFYFIPKILMEKLDKRICKIETTHFCPMRPLSIYSFIPYLTGRIKSRNYYKKLGNKVETLQTLQTPYFQYVSNNWFEGFQNTYFPLIK